MVSTRHISIRRRSPPVAGGPVILFTGDMAYFPNRGSRELFRAPGFSGDPPNGPRRAFSHRGPQPGPQCPATARDSRRRSHRLRSGRPDLSGPGAGGGGAVFDRGRNSEQDSGSHGLRPAGGRYAAHRARPVEKCGGDGRDGKYRRRAGREDAAAAARSGTGSSQRRRRPQPRSRRIQLAALARQAAADRRRVPPPCATRKEAYAS